MKTKNFIMLITAALIWGIAFVAQSEGMKYVGPFTFNAVRCIIGAITLLPCVFIMDKYNAKQNVKTKKPTDKKGWKTLILGGVFCGLALCVGSNLQQFGIQYTTVGKAGFITALYIVLVPVFSIFIGKKAGIKVWLSVLIAVGGLYLLCMQGDFSFAKGDIYLLLCAFAFTAHILVIDKFSPLVDGVRMSCIQFLTCGLISAVLMFIYEKPTFSSILSAWLPVMYAGVLSCGVAYTLQIIAQKGISPTVASLTLSLESVFSVLAGFVILGQTLSIKELAGCVLMLAAIVLAQLPQKTKKIKI